MMASDGFVHAALDTLGIGAGVMSWSPSAKQGLRQQDRRVVPSPALSLVLEATSLTSCAPMFSNGFGSSILLGDRDAVVNDQRRAELLVETTERPLGRASPGGVCELVYALLKHVAGFLLRK